MLIVGCWYCFLCAMIDNWLVSSMCGAEMRAGNSMVNTDVVTVADQEHEEIHHPNCRGNCTYLPYHFKVLHI